MSVSVQKTGIVSATGEIGLNQLKYIPKSHNPADYMAYQLDLSANLVANETYTLQLWDIDIAHSAKTAAQLSVAVYWGGGSVNLVRWTGTDYITNGHAEYLVNTFTISSSQASHSQAANAWLNIYNSPANAEGTRNLTIGRWKLEKGSVPTAWCPNSTDEIYVGSTSGFNEFSNIMQITKGYVNASDFIEY